MSAKKAKAPKVGRPKGSKNVAEVVEVTMARCQQCQSTNGEVLRKAVQEYAGVTDRGHPYNRIVRRHTRCKDCGQVRIERSLEFDPDLPILG